MLIFVLCFISVFSGAQSWSWASGPTSNAYSISEAMATDAAGNTYITGKATDSTWFGTHLLTGQGYYLFIAKYTSSGICAWASSYAPLVNGFGLAIDANGNSFVLGQRAGIDSILKWDPSGNLLWAKPLPSNAAGNYLTGDPSGNIWVCGRITSGSAVFGSATIVGPAGFAAKFDLNGNALLAFQLGFNDKILPRYMAVDANGDISIAASLYGNDSLANQALTCLGSSLLVIRLDASGNLTWLKQGVAPPNLTAHAGPFGLCLDPLGNCYVNAVFMFHDFIFDYDTVHTSTLSQRTAAIIKFDANGNVDWLRQSTNAGTGDVYFMSIVSDSNAVYFTGYSEDNFTLGPHTIIDTSNTYHLGYIIGMDFSGNPLFEMCTSGNNSLIGPNGISVDAFGGVYISGYRDHGINFGPFNLPVTNGGDAFVAKLQLSPASVVEFSSAYNVVLLPTENARTFMLRFGETSLDLHTRFVLYDGTGRVVKTILAAPQTLVDCRDLADGIYYWSVENNADRFATGKLVNQ